MSGAQETRVRIVQGGWSRRTEHASNLARRRQLALLMIISSRLVINAARQVLTTTLL